MRAKEMRGQTIEELLGKKAECVENMFQDKLKNATHQLDKSHTLRANRREIARINTILSERARLEEQKNDETDKEKPQDKKKASKKESTKE